MHFTWPTTIFELASAITSELKMTNEHELTTHCAYMANYQIQITYVAKKNTFQQCVNNCDLDKSKCDRKTVVERSEQEALFIICVFARIGLNSVWLTFIHQL